MNRVAIGRSTDAASVLEEFLDSMSDDISRNLFDDLEDVAERIEEIVEDLEDEINELHEIIDEKDERIAELEEESQ